jgi:hypothetical protein
MKKTFLRVFVVLSFCTECVLSMKPAITENYTELQEKMATVSPVYDAKFLTEHASALHKASGTDGIVDFVSHIARLLEKDTSSTTNKDMQALIEVFKTLRGFEQRLLTNYTINIQKKAFSQNEVLAKLIIGIRGLENGIIEKLFDMPCFLKFMSSIFSVVDFNKTSVHSLQKRSIVLFLTQIKDAGGKIVLNDSPDFSEIWEAISILTYTEKNHLSEVLIPFMNQLIGPENAWTEEDEDEA